MNLDLSTSDRHRLQLRWTKQLYVEHERICYQHRLKLAPAVMVVGDFASPLARWDATKRSIEVSFDFICKHPWPIVLEVLRHEIAHQIVDELFKQHCIHGAWFKKAAEMVGLASWATAACLDLNNLAALRQTPKLPPEQERLLAKAQKLLALAASANRCEAELAMQKVHELYATYHLHLLRETNKPEFTAILIEQGQKRIATYQSLIASLLVKFFHVQVIHTSCFNAADCETYKALELLGLSHQVEMAEYVYYFLDNKAKSLWKEFKAEPGNKKGLKPSSFYQGVIAGFREKLEHQHEHHQQKHECESDARQEKEVRLALRHESQRLEAYVAYRHPRLHSISVGGSRRSSQLFAAGKKKGQQLVLHRPLKQGNSGKVFFLNKAKGH